jgi:hypothetical protein
MSTTLRPDTGGTTGRGRTHCTFKQNACARQPLNGAREVPANWFHLSCRLRAPLVTSAPSAIDRPSAQALPLPPEQAPPRLLDRTRRRSRARRLGGSSAVGDDLRGDDATPLGQPVPAPLGTPDVVDPDEMLETVSARPLAETGRHHEIARRSVASEEGREDRFVARHERQRTAGQTAMPEPAEPSRNAPIVDHLPAETPAPPTASVEGRTGPCRNLPKPAPRPPACLEARPHRVATARSDTRHARRDTRDTRDTPRCTMSIVTCSTSPASPTGCR